MANFDFSFQDIIDSAQYLVVVTQSIPLEDPGPEIVYVNRAFTQLTGYSFEEAVGQPAGRFLLAETSTAAKEELISALEQQQEVRTSLRSHTKSGQEYWLDLIIQPLHGLDGNLTHFVITERILSEHQALPEPELPTALDHLPSTHTEDYFLNLLTFEHSGFRRTGETFACLRIDIDDFDQLGEQHGPNMGDRALEALVTEIKSCLRQYDSIAHLGDERFAVLLPAISSATAQSVADRLRARVERTLHSLQGRNVGLTISIGVTIVNSSDQEAEETIARAQRLLHDARHQGRNLVISDD